MDTLDRIIIGIVHYGGTLVVVLAFVAVVLWASYRLWEKILRSLWKLELVLRTAWFLSRSTTMPPEIGAKRNADGEWEAQLRGFLWPPSMGPSRFHAIELAPDGLAEQVDPNDHDLLCAAADTYERLCPQAYGKLFSIADTLREAAKKSLQQQHEALTRTALRERT